MIVRVRLPGVLLKLVGLALTWVTTVAIGTLVFAIVLDGWSRTYFAAALFVGAMIISERVLGVRLSFGAEPSTKASRKTAVEQEALRLRDMLALLDEDDLDDLRAEVREGLRERIRNLTADETESFDDLLTDPGTKRKREARR